MGRISRRLVATLTAVSLLLLSIVLLHRIIFTWLGSYLVQEQPPYRADVISVLGGDFRGGRILTAAALARKGYAPIVLVSGSGPIYGRNECDLAVIWAVSQGYKDNLFVKVPTTALSTEEEAQEVTQAMRRRHVKRFLLVTSNYHTHRAARIFHRLAPDLDFHVIGSPDLYFTPDGWWKSREGQKTFAFEWTKTFSNWVGD